MVEQARDAAARAARLLDLWQDYRRRSDIGRSAAVLRLIDELFASPFITINHASQVMSMSFKSATKNVDRLVRAGILREITGQQRFRVYGADEIFRLLDEPLGTEPNIPQ